MTAEAVSDMPKMPVHGRYIIEITDVKGRVRTYETDNYVSEVHYDQARVMQAQQAVSSSHFPDDVSSLSATLVARRRVADNSYLSNLATNWPFLICTDWDEAEDTTETWAKGNVVAFAPKVKVTALSTGRKGLVNETESTVSNDLQVWTWVWDWTTNQGNGTFQSILMGALGVYSDTNAALYCAAGEHGRAFSLNSSTQLPGSTWRPITDGTDVWMVGPSTTSPYVRWAQFTAEFDGTDPGVTLDGSGNWHRMPGASGAGNDFASMVEPSVTFMTNTTSSSSGSQFYAGPGWDACTDGTNIYFLSVSNNGNSFAIRAFNIATGTSLYQNTTSGWTPAVIGVGYTFHITGITHLSSKLYAVYAFSNTSNITDRQRIARLNPTTGAFEAFLDLSSSLAPDQQLTGVIDNDGTDLIVETTQGIIKVTTGGAIVDNSNIGMVRLPYQYSTSSPDGMGNSIFGHFEEQGVAPDPTSRFHQLQQYRSSPTGLWGSRRGPNIKSENFFTDDSFQNRFLVDLHEGQLSAPWIWQSGSFPSQLGPVGWRLMYYDNVLWIADMSISNSTDDSATEVWPEENYCGIYSLDGLNFFSRARLDSPVTKSSSETMKITYQLTLPANAWRRQALKDPYP